MVSNINKVDNNMHIVFLKITSTWLHVHQSSSNDLLSIDCALYLNETTKLRVFPPILFS